MEASETTHTDKIALLLRGFHTQAERDVMAAMLGPQWSQSVKEQIAADPALFARLVDAQAKRYTDQFVETYDKTPGKRRSWAEIVASAADYNRDLLNALQEGGGKADDFVELDVAIRKKNVDGIKTMLQRQPYKQKVSTSSSRNTNRPGVSTCEACSSASLATKPRP
jgi:hypothetical protein